MEVTDTVSLPTTLDPLPDSLQRGLTAVAFFGILSLCSSSLLFLVLTYKLLRWRIKGDAHHGVNQFFILIYNLLIADVHQAVAFTLTTVYLIKNEINVDSPTCWANGWFVSVGDLASSVFVFSIGLHTFIRVIARRELRDRVFYLWIGGAWVFVYVVAVITVTIHPGIYVRAGAWCWIDQRFKQARLWLHYIWIFIAMFGTVVIYASIYFVIQLRVKSSTHLEGLPQIAEMATTRRAAKYMVIYPIVYVLCTLPLAGGRMVAMTKDVVVPYWFYCFAGAAITSCGWLDVVLYSLTRRRFIFSASPPPKDDHALNTLEWNQNVKFYGTTTTIEGPLSPHTEGARQGHRGSVASLRRWRSSTRRRHSDEHYFGSTSEGVIVTKTTIEVVSELADGFSGSETSVLALQERPPSASPSVIRPSSSYQFVACQGGR